MDSTAVWELDDALKKQDGDARRISPGTVSDIDDQGVIWVRLVGSDEDTPVTSSTASVDKGDVVNVRIEGGRAWIDGSTSNPSASTTALSATDAKAMQAMGDAAMASAAAQSALMSADIASDAANNAVESAANAEQAASDAWDKAASAESAATTAQQLANNAKTSADAARASADTALEQAVLANAAADQAIEEASVAAAAADEASVQAEEAHAAADEAQASADTAQASADNAQASADRALSDAMSAMQAANDAYAQLGDVESVIDTLGWFSEHAVKTSDEHVDPDKKYYTFADGSYKLVEEPTDEGIRTYSLTSDVEVDPEKTYYEYDVELEEYVVVQNPVDEDLGSYYEMTVNYYELDSTIQNYVASHLSLTDDGLYLVMDDSDMRLRLATDGVHVVNSVGHEVAAFTNSGITFDDQVPQTIGGENSYIRWYDSDPETLPNAPDSLEISADKITVGSDDVMLLIQNAQSVADGAAAQVASVVKGLLESSSFVQTEDGFQFSIDSAIEGAMQAADDARRVATDYLSFETVGGVGQLTIGTTDSGVRNVITNNRFSFKNDDGQDLAYFGLDSDSGVWKLFIDNASITDMLSFGNFAWIRRSNGNMSLKWLGGEQ